MKNRSLFFDTSLIYFVVILCFVALRVFASTATYSSAIGEVLSITIQLVFMLAIPFLMYKLLRKKNTKQVLKDFNVKKISFKAVLIAVLIGFIVYFLNLAVASFFNIFINAVGYDPSFGMSSATTSYTLVAFLWDVLATAILPGICEEFCHRGLLVNGYKQLGMKMTIVLVGFLFGLMHLNIEQFFYATVIGMFLTFLVYVTGSIIPSMIIHFMNNFMGLYITFAYYHNLPLGNFGDNLFNALSGSNAFIAFFAIVFVVIILLALLAFLVYCLMKNTRVKQFEALAKKAIEQKQREELFKQFNLDANEDAPKNEQENVPEVRINNFGRRGIVVDFNFSKFVLEGDCSIKKPSLKDKIFLYGTIFMGIAITISTLIWGVL